MAPQIITEKSISNTSYLKTGKRNNGSVTSTCFSNTHCILVFSKWRTGAFSGYTADIDHPIPAECDQ
jgi:hypothetical protein